MLRRAFPGGLTNVFAVLLCQAFMDVFGLPADPIATVCAGILAVVGMLVLFQICKPFNRFRVVIWCAMLLGLLLVFGFLGPIFELHAGSIQTKLVMVTLLLVTPTVYLLMLYAFDYGEKLYRKIKNK